MPIWLRRYTFQRLKEFYEKQESPPEQSTSTKKLPKGPDISPSYTSKVSSK